VVGGGDTAMEEANFLTKFATKVTIVHRKDTLRASKTMQDRARKNPKIEILLNHEVIELKHDQSGLNAIVVQNTKTLEKSNRATDGLFYGIGHTPNTGFLANQITLDALGFIVTKKGLPDTNVEGVFACGDVQDNYFRQAISAAGSGCQAAMRAERYLEEKHLH
jgi:thioredoxin reductase (NADPH)